MPTRGLLQRAPLGDCGNVIHTLGHGKLKGKNGQHFVLLPKAISLQKLREKNGQHSVLLLYTKATQNPYPS